LKEAYAENFVEPVPRGAEVEYPSEVNRPYKVVPVPDYSRWGECGSVEKVTPMGRMEAESAPRSRMPPPTQTHPHHHSRGVIQLEGETYLLIKPLVEGTLKQALNGNINNPDLDHKVILNWMLV
jgi:hypothetical protein